MRAARPVPVLGEGPPAGAGDERGVAMVSVMFLIAFVAALGVGLLQEGLSARRSIARHEGNLLALEAAETGIARAEQEIRSLVDSAADGVGNVAGSTGSGTYDVRAATTPLGASRYVLRATGVAGLSVRRIETCVRRRPRARVVEALFTQDSLTFSNNVRTDAYDSRLGTYASQARSTDAWGTYALVGGGIGSNGSVTLDGPDVVVRGDVIPGPGRVAELRNGATVLGDMLPRDVPVDLPPPSLEEFRAAWLSNANDTVRRSAYVRYDAATGSLSLGGGVNLTLASGTYFFRDVRITGGSTLTISGSVTIYATGSLDFSGGSVVNTGRPQDLFLYCHPYPLPTGAVPAASTVKIRGGSQLVAALYAPGATLDVSGGCDIYGGVVAKTLVAGSNCTFHQDLSLPMYGVTLAAHLQRIYWRDPTPPNR